MATYYVGPGGNDGNSGLTWALRKLTLNGAEDIPVAAGDIVYVGPGVYRETLTIDVSGGAGSPIVYIGDVSGEHTDGIGGIVRITGSDDDQTAVRANCVIATTKNYRTFRGFDMEFTSSHLVSLNTHCSNWIIEDCYFYNRQGIYYIVFTELATNNIIRRCFLLLSGGSRGIYFSSSVFNDNSNNLIENVMIVGGGGSRCINVGRVGGIIVKNSTLSGDYCLRVDVALNAGQFVNVFNCNLWGGGAAALRATALGEIIEDYNTFYGNNVDRNTVAVGGNSQTIPPLFLPPLFLDGIRYPRFIGELSEWSQVSRRLDAADDADITYYYAVSVTEDDLYGIYRPTGISLLSWGALQLREGERETTTVRTGTASIILDSAGDHQIFVPVTNISTTFEVYVYREANYEGLAPQMIIRQPGQDDEVVTDTGLAGAWNQLTKTLTPAADPPYVCVILRSHNTALTGNYNVFFDDLDVS